jgi:hypothetical protein
MSVDPKIGSMFSGQEGVCVQAYHGPRSSDQERIHLGPQSAWTLMHIL